MKLIKLSFFNAEMHHTFSWCKEQPPKPWGMVTLPGRLAIAAGKENLYHAMGQPQSGNEGCWKYLKSLLSAFYWYHADGMVWWVNPCLLISAWAPGSCDCAHHNLLCSKAPIINFSIFSSSLILFNLKLKLICFSSDVLSNKCVHPQRTFDYWQMILFPIVVIAEESKMKDVGEMPGQRVGGIHLLPFSLLLFFSVCNFS